MGFASLRTQSPSVLGETGQWKMSTPAGEEVTNWARSGCLPRAEKAIIRQAQDGLYSGLKAVDMLKYRRGVAAIRRAGASISPPADWPRAVVVHGG